MGKLKNINLSRLIDFHGVKEVAYWRHLLFMIYIGRDSFLFFLHDATCAWNVWIQYTFFLCLSSCICDSKTLNNVRWWYSYGILSAVKNLKIPSLLHLSYAISLYLLHLMHAFTCVRFYFLKQLSTVCKSQECIHNRFYTWIKCSFAFRQSISEINVYCV